MDHGTSVARMSMGEMYRNVGSYAGWWFGTFDIFPFIGNVIIPTDEAHHLSEG